MRKVAAAASLLLLVAVLASALLKEERTPFPLLDRPAPALNLPSPNGGRLADLADEVVLVNFFASWCAPCVVEHPQLAELATTAPIIGIAYKDEPQDTADWLKKHGNIFGGIGLDSDGLASLAWGISGVPETFIVDENRRLRHRHRGPIMPQDLEAIRAVLAEVKND